VRQKFARSALHGAISKLASSALDLRELAEEAAEKTWLEDRQNAQVAVNSGDLKLYADRLFEARYRDQVGAEEDPEFAAEQFAEVFMDRLIDLSHGLA